MLICHGRNDNVDTVHEGLLRWAIWRLTSPNGGERPKHRILDIVGLPIEVVGLVSFSVFAFHLPMWITGGPMM